MGMILEDQNDDFDRLKWSQSCTAQNTCRIRWNFDHKVPRFNGNILAIYILNNIVGALPFSLWN